MYGCLAGLAIACVLLQSACTTANTRLQRIRARGFLVCGVHPEIVGFATVDTNGHYAGFDVDMCRAVATAIFGAPDRSRFVPAPSVQHFLDSDEIDIVSRRLTWTLEREGSRLLFGPVSFFDGQGFLLPRARGISTVQQLSGAKVCIVPGLITEFNLATYFRTNHLALNKVALPSSNLLDEAFSTGQCDAYTGDLSELGSARVGLKDREAYEILDTQISKEPLAQLVRNDDVGLFMILRWSVFALIAAEELGVTSQNLPEMETSDRLDVQRLLGLIPGNGRSLGLDERWAYNIIRALGNYGEIYERNLGMSSPVRLPRGLNAQWTAGGLMYAPLFRQ